MKTAAGDYLFASSDGTPQLFQKMFPGDLSNNLTMSRTKVSYMISDGLGPYFRQNCAKIFHSRVLGIPFSMTRQGIPKAASSVTYWYAIGHKRKRRSVFLADTIHWGCQRS